MKKLRDLTNDDLATTPVWECKGGLDEIATVSKAKGFHDLDNTVYVARTRFMLNDGTELFGYCSPTDDSGLDYVQPVIVTHDGHARFWYDQRPVHKEPEYLCSIIGKTLGEIFPVQYECLLPVAGQIVKATINAIGGAI